MDMMHVLLDSKPNSAWKPLLGVGSSCDVFGIGLMPLQVLGHSKTILVLLTSWAVFQEGMTQRKLLGMALAVVGMIMYGFITSTAFKPVAVETIKSKKSQ